MPRGGSRPGAGRKRTAPVTVTVRIPEALRPTVEAMGQEHRERLRTATERAVYPHMLLSAAARLAELSERRWEDGGDGLTVDSLPLEETDEAIRANLAGWGLGSIADDLLRTRRERDPIAIEARRLLAGVCPLADEEIRGIVYVSTDGFRFDARNAVRLLHAWGLLLDDLPDIQPASGAAVAGWLLEHHERGNGDWCLPDALAEGRVDVAKALGVGLRQGHPRECAVAWYRSRLPTARVETWAAYPGASDFCCEIHPLLPEVVRLPQVESSSIYKFLDDVAWTVRPFIRIAGQPHEPDPGLLRAFRSWHRAAVEAVGEDALFRILEDLFGHKRATVETWLSAAGSIALGWRDVLELPPGVVTLRVAKAAYRRLAGRHHPDKGGDHMRMQAINQAWQEAQAELRA